MATSRMADIRGFLGNSGRSAPSFAPQSFNSTRVGSNAGAAADIPGITGVYSSLREKAPKMDQIVATANDINHSLDDAALAAKGKLFNAGTVATGSAIRGKIQADQLNKQAQAAERGGIASLFGGIAGGALSLATGGIV